jgi:GNAT superfamily N-acetyltransferase
MSVRVRPLEARDKPEWLALFAAYCKFYRAQVPAEVVEVTWQRLMAGGEGVHACLVAVDGTDRPIGIANILLHRSTWSPTWYCYLEDLFVDPDHRGAGAGRALIEAVYAYADNHHATRVYWTTEEGNTTARALYDKLATKSPFVQYRR